jgi:membrane protease YdiL (CAAX protease family)
VAVDDEADERGDRGGAAEAPPRPRAHSLRFIFAAAAVTTAVVTATSYLAPERHAATGVGLGFIAATWWLVLRHDERTVRAHGLSLGGLLEPVPLEVRRLLRDFAIACAWALLFMLVIFPVFWFGFRYYRHVHTPFVLRAPASLVDELAGQVFVIALPEEAFFRGYLQTALDQHFPPRWRLLGASMGPGLLVSAVIFAIGHVLTTPDPARLAVFFPALAFGWLRARTGGVGASVIFHAACNLFSSTLARGYGMGPP